MRATIGEPATGSTADRGEWNATPFRRSPRHPRSGRLGRHLPSSHPRHAGRRSYHIGAEVDFCKFPQERTASTTEVRVCDSRRHESNSSVRHALGIIRSSIIYKTQDWMA